MPIFRRMVYVVACYQPLTVHNTSRLPQIIDILCFWQWIFYFLVEICRKIFHFGRSIHFHDMKAKIHKHSLVI